MTAPVVLDTDVVVDVLRGHSRVIERLREISPDRVGVSAMTVAELRYGALASADPERNWGEAARFLGQVRVLPFGRRTAAVHARLRWALRRNPIGPHDLVIAATAVAVGARLATGNVRAFSRIEELAVESWR